MVDQAESRVLSPGNRRLHLTFLDGLRGILAFYVVLFHVVAGGDQSLALDTFLLNFLRFGHEAVVGFIVLSGFVLALPMARWARQALPGELRGFFNRRALRILPGYYAALFLYPLCFLLVECLKYVTGEGADWGRIRGLFISADMLSHLFLLQNLSESWSSSVNLNPVLWSMSTEWWIYFVFALILLPMWRRFGVFSAACASMVLGLLPIASLSLGGPTLAGFPYLLGAFGLGMAGAALVCRNSEASEHLFRRWRVGMIAAASIASVLFCYIAVAASSIRMYYTTRWISDLLLAVIFSSFVVLATPVAAARHHTSGAIALTIRILESRPVVWLGQISYSLYLTHLTVWLTIRATLGLAPIKRIIHFPVDSLGINVLVLIPTLLLAAYGFHLLFEKPFLTRQS
jgi:peptidoglycan/LPS O-acetylase OafA/YrhL